MSIHYLTIALALVLAASAGAESLPRDDGYRGIWYNIGTKYSGGLATYPQQHIPICYYSAEADKTFFCYGGTVEGKSELLHMISYFDHKTGEVPRPVILMNKQTGDAHDNPTMTMDSEGYLYIFSNAHGLSRPAYIYRSAFPWSIDRLDLVLETNFSYGQPWYVPDKGILFLHTRYTTGGVRELFWQTSEDGLNYSEPRQLASFSGHYQISWATGQKVATAFDFHPRGLDNRTNIYYVQSEDFGQTWTNAAGQKLEMPLKDRDNAALVHDYQADGLLVYLKDLQFDRHGRPVILYLTSKGHESGPENGPRVWRTARWDGSKWVIRRVTTSDHNYDHGSLYIEEDGAWRIIAPTDPGPQEWATGGEMVMWLSRDEGMTWKRVKQLTRDSERNHTYARHPAHAHPDFYTIWADGNAHERSESFLYFTDRDGSQVWRLPEKMEKQSERPIAAW